MNWNLGTKHITDLQTIRIQQALNRGGGSLICPSPLVFTWADLVLSLARTTTIESAVPELTQEERRSLAYSNGAWHAERINLFLDAHNAEFAITTKVGILADEELTSLAAKVGAAVADLVMERMGFHWRANMRELKLEQSEPIVDSKKRMPDFVYDPGGEHGFQPKSVVVVEAKGSLSKTRAKRVAIRRLARNAYKGQVQHVIGKEGCGVVVAGGYAIAFGAIPGGHVGVVSGENVSTLAIASPQSIAVDASITVKAKSLSAAATYGVRQIQQVHEQAEHQQQQQEELRRQMEQIHGGGPGGPSDGGPRREGERRTPSGRVAYANYEYAFLLCGADNAASLIRHVLRDCLRIVRRGFLLALIVIQAPDVDTKDPGPDGQDRQEDEALSV